MTDAQQSLLTVTGVSGRISIDASYNALLAAGGSKADLHSGFRIASEQTKQSLQYPAISLVSQPVPNADPPDLQIDMQYDQKEGYEEVDLDLRWEHLPQSGVSIANVSDYSDFEINKRAIDQSSGVYGKMSLKNEPIQATMSLKLWFDDPDSIPPNAQFTLEVGHVAEAENDPRAVERMTDSGPTKFVPLGMVTLYPKPQD